MLSLQNAVTEDSGDPVSLSFKTRSGFKQISPPAFELLVRSRSNLLGRMKEKHQWQWLK
jgi:hypothetical protein